MTVSQFSASLETLRTSKITRVISAWVNLANQQQTTNEPTLLFKIGYAHYRIAAKWGAKTLEEFYSVEELGHMFQQHDYERGFVHACTDHQENGPFFLGRAFNLN